MNAAQVHLWCGELDDTERLAEAGRRLARAHGEAWFMPVGAILQACILVHRGEPEVGLSLLIERLLQYRSLGAPYWVPLYLSFAADAYRQVGRVEEGLATMAEAVRLTETNCDIFWAAEVHRLKGELTLQQFQVSGSKFQARKGSRFKVQSL
jgi:predicted ATPase